MSYTIRSEYNKFVGDLIKKLPMEDSHFSAQLTKEGFFDIGGLKAKVRAQSTNAEKAEYFLDKAIFPFVDEKDEDVDLQPLYKLLNAMERFGGPAKTLAQKIKVAIPLTEDGGNGDDRIGDCRVAGAGRGGTEGPLKKIQQQYTNLIQLDVKKLLPNLFAKSVVDQSQKETIEGKPGMTQRMQHFLDKVIIPSLRAGTVSKFKGFLEVIEESGDPVIKEVGGRLGSSAKLP